MAGQTNGHSDGRPPELIENHRQGRILERSFYTDPAVFELEAEKIFHKYWLYAGHVSQIPNPGDYFLRNVLDESLIIIRGDDGQVHALYNVCRHRGSQICWEETGHMGNLVCPYHAWVYKRDGSLKHARLFPEDFDKSRFGLHRAPVEVLEGFIFFSLSNEPVDFEPVSRDLRPHLEWHDFGSAKVCHTEYLDLHANWKILNENARECYHCGPAHPDLCRAVPFAAATGAPKYVPEEERLNKLAEARWSEIGLPARMVDQTVETWYQAFRLPLFESHVSFTLDGRAVAPLMGYFERPEDAGQLTMGILPTFWFEASSDYAVVMCFTPAEPALTKLKMDWLVRGDAVEGRDYQVEQLTEMWRVISGQDWQLCEGAQVGISSRHYAPGPLAGVESWLDTLVQWYLGQLKS